ncbi:MAG: AAA family ATPase [Caulobacter sp.]|nr:AAA family ATPase [Caulobacter sp.]
MFDAPTKTFSREEIDTLRAHLAAYREETTPPRTWARIAQDTGVNEKTIAAWVPGTYDKGDYWKNQDVPAKVERFLASRTERASLAAAMPKRLDYRMMPSGKRMMTCLALAQLADMAMIATAPGCGKTMAVKQFKQTRANVFVATVSKGCGGPADVLGALLSDMGEPGARSHIGALKRRISERVQGADALIIIDEAQHCTPACLEELRAIHDATECGLALVGDNHLPGLLKGFAQLHSRIGVSHLQTVPDPADIDILADAWGVKDEPALAFIRRTGATAGAGGLRRVDKVIRLAVMQARSEGRDLDVQDLKDAFAQRYQERI